jgi:hypothetical protein
MPDRNLGVVHLVRHVNGIEPFETFVESYRQHPAGAPHKLVLVLKGFDDDASAEPYRRRASGLGARYLRVPDDGYDLGSYRRAASELPYGRLLFLNSFSAILVDDWLARLVTAAADPFIGAVAASGSWGSRASHMRYDHRLGGPYATIFPGRDVTRRVFSELTGASAQSSVPPATPASPPSLAARVAGRLLGVAMVAHELVQFAEFPSPHLRTNGLLVDRQRWLDVCRRSPREKLAAHRLESGRRGITARLTAMGLRVLVVGRDGRAYDKSEWPDSRTFWQCSQENLLVEDNQTRAYMKGDAQTRRVLSAYAWGFQANPTGAQSSGTA